MKRSIVAVLTACLALALVPGPAAAAGRQTNTNAEVCCPDGALENFGAYRFRGEVRGARDGAVRFFYKRPNADKWKSFKVAGDDGVDGTGFYVLNRERPRDAVNDLGEFSVQFTPSVGEGRWLLRASYLGTRIYSESRDVVSVVVSGSD